MKLKTLEDRLSVRRKCLDESRESIKRLKEVIQAHKIAIREMEKEIRHQKFLEGIARFDEFNWKELLAGAFDKSREDSQKTRDAFNVCVPGRESHSLSGCWNETDQTVVRIRIEKDDPQHAKDWAVFLERILPYIIPHSDGVKKFGLENYSYYVGYDADGLWQLNRHKQSDVYPRTFLSVESLTEYIRIHHGYDPHEYDTEED